MAKKIRRRQIKTLEDLAFGCPDGTIGVVSGFSQIEFTNPTERDKSFIWFHAAQLGCRTLKYTGITLTVGY